MAERTKDGRFLSIDEIWAFISKDVNGNEGILGFQTSNGQWVPMIGADTSRIASLKPIADRVILNTGMNYEIRYFKKAKD